jgi:hypothetical protein
MVSRTIFSPRLRLLAGALLIVGGLLWVRQNEVPLGLKAAVAAGTVDQKQAESLARRLWAAGSTGTTKVSVIKTKPLSVPGLPASVAGLFDSINPIVAGGLILLTAFSGSIVAWLSVGLAAAIVLAGHKVGLPIPDNLAGMNPRQLVLAAGSALGVLALILFRHR